MALVVTGAQAIIRISGEILAFASGVSVTHENRLEEIPQLDSLEVGEYADNGHRCSLSINLIKLAPDAAIESTRISNSALTYSLESESDLKTALLQPEMIIEIVQPVLQGDVLVDQLVYVAYGCKFEGGSGQMDARGIWQGTWNFKARRGVGI